jgi:D-beta-D-heptose 7-phosphate kinase/D-beta-D-heptose 1-phosphate adenosyltransferase
MKTVVVISGGFDPIHAGHIALIKSARELGNHLIVGVNSDTWLTRKKGAAFMPWHHRAEVVRNLRQVDEVMSWEDHDNSAIGLLEQVKREFPNDQIIFANGGDRTAVNIPEMSVTDVIFKFGIGGEDKQGSSSNFLQDWKQPITTRSWGNYRVLYEHLISGPSTKVKELVVEPGQSLSLQKHKYRNELWHVVEGNCNVFDDDSMTHSLGPHDQIDILAGEWHRLSNPFTSPCKIVEIQYGSQCDELDIERKSS